MTKESVYATSKLWGKNKRFRQLQRVLGIQACNISVFKLYVLGRSGVSDSLWPPYTVALQVLLYMVFSRRRLPFNTPGNFPDPEIQPASFVSPAMADGSFSTSATCGALNLYIYLLFQFFTFFVLLSQLIK